jgi:SAM-dependent methyltransferase
MSASQLWESNARHWDSIGFPLHPSPQDIAILSRLLADLGAALARPRACLLGVTPEIALMRWPPETRLFAFDYNPAMIKTVWPGARLANAAVACANWARMPVADAACDIVVGDGCFSALDYPEGYAAVSSEIRRILRPGGLFAVRAFIRPDRPEPVGTVFDDLRAGRIGNFHIFKWRLNMALHGDLAAGVRLSDSWDAWRQAFPDPAVLARTLNWPIEEISTIDAYRGVDTRYTFPTLEELREALASYFLEMACVHPGYELGERCPTLLFQ